MVYHECRWKVIGLNRMPMQTDIKIVFRSSVIAWRWWPMENINIKINIKTVFHRSTIGMPLISMMLNIIPMVNMAFYWLAIRLQWYTMVTDGKNNRLLLVAIIYLCRPIWKKVFRWSVIGRRWWPMENIWGYLIPLQTDIKRVFRWSVIGKRWWPMESMW